MLAEFGKEAGQRLAAIRHAKFGSRRKAVEHLSVTEKTLGTWERGEADPGVRGHWPEIEQAFGVTRAEILGEAEPKQLDRLEAEITEQRLMLEALLEEIRPGWRELLRPPEGLLRLRAFDPNSAPDPDDPDTEAEDDPPRIP